LQTGCLGYISSPEGGIVLEQVDQFGVGGGELVGGEGGAGDPGESVAVDGLGFAALEGAVEEAEADGFFRVGVGDFLDLVSHGDFDAEFFAEFADEAMLEGFVALDLAAREFPQSAEVIVWPPLGDQELPASEYEARRDIDDFAH
jgi:hypothetical protein